MTSPEPLDIAPAAPCDNCGCDFADHEFGTFDSWCENPKCLGYLDSPCKGFELGPVDASNAPRSRAEAEQP